MKTLAKRGSIYPSDEENPYWISFSDIMSGLLVVFILASLALILELMQTREDVNAALDEMIEAENVRYLIVTELQQELINNNIKVELVDNDTVIRIPDDQLTFGSDRYRISERDETTQERVRLIGDILYEKIREHSGENYLDTIFIEGHTDSQRSRRFKEMGNWGLSTFRAISVWKFWNNPDTEQNKFEELVNHDGRKLFSVSGYAALRRIEQRETTKFDFQKNRRIDIRFTVKRPKIEDLRSVQKKF